MFKSRYVFETKETRFWRYIKSVVAIFIFIIISYLVLCALIVSSSKQETLKTNSTFFNNTIPDMIAVFTGDIGRISFAIEKAKDYKQPNIFITGVYSKNTVQSIINRLNIKEDFDFNMLEIDYSARNTVENVISTLDHIRKSKNIETVVIISHDYHIIRIKLIMNHLRPIADPTKIYYTGIETDYTSWRNIKILCREVFKIIRVYLLLTLWDHDIAVDFN